MSFELDEDFEWFLEEFGTPEKHTEVTESTILKYSDSLPRQLLIYWEQYGFCSFKNGLFSIVNPEDYTSILEGWLSNAGLIAEEFSVVAKNAFGDLYLYHKENAFGIVIKPRNLCVFLRKGHDKKVESNAKDEEVKIFFGTKDPSTIDLKDVYTDKLIFADAVKKFGPLAPDEMFTFEPALFLGGEQTLKTVNKVNVFVQLELLLKMGTPQVMDIHGLAKKAFT